MNEQKTPAAQTVSSYVIDAWKCPKCGANNKFNPHICTSCNYSKIPPIQTLPPQSRRVWEKISLILILVMAALQLAYAVTYFTGIGLTVLHDIKGSFLDTALICPDMLLYSHFASGGVSALMAAATAVFAVIAIKNKEKLSLALHNACIFQAVSLWAFPVINILTDMVVTSIKVDGVQLRSSTDYDLFDMGMKIIWLDKSATGIARYIPHFSVAVIITLIILAVIYVNNRLAPTHNDNEEE